MSEVSTQGKGEMIGARIIKILKWVEIILVILVVFFLLAFILFERVLPAHGVHVSYNNEGESMEPTLREGGMVISVETPYEELQVGDIIEFRNPFFDMSMNVTMFKKNPETGQLESTVTVQNIPASQDRVIHRIVEITEDGLLTKGDNNPVDDPKLISASDYISKIVWWNNYIGWPFKVMYVDNLMQWLLPSPIIVGGIILITWMLTAPLPTNAAGTSAASSIPNADDESDEDVGTDAEGKVS